MNIKLQEHYLASGLAKKKLCGQIVWTRETKKRIPQRVRIALIRIIFGHKCPSHLVDLLKLFGFDSKGYYEEIKS